MPHKRNPVMCERIAGLARVLRANAMVAMENVALWHERDISHSSAERIIIPDSAILLDYMLTQMTEIIRGLLVYPDNMTANLSKTKGLVFSARILVELEKRGVERRKAYDIIQRCAMKVWKEDINFKKALLDDGDFIKSVKPGKIDDFFDVTYYTKHVNAIFKKVGI